MRRMKFLAVLTLCVFGTTVAFGAVRTSAPVRGATNTGARGDVTAARSATPVARSGVAARSATPTKTSTVTARAATTQKVINNGTKVTTATANTVVSEECKTKYYGCMDSFCMLDNTSGGRCLCSDRNAELDKVATEIQRLDEQTYAMATTGVERIEMGADAEDVIAQANAVAQSFTNPNSSAAVKRQSLDMPLWTSTVDFDDGSDGEEGFVDAFDGKTGASLFSAVNDLCIESIPECSSETSMLQLMYSQQIRSDCTAYENSLKQQRANSVQKLAAAESALRDAALEQYRSANKYDLGQCTIEFKKCMITTADCGEDFSKCASMVALDNTNATAKSAKGNKKNSVSIQGTNTKIDIYATTYDTLVAKKPLCENVLRSCQKVQDKVWDTFLAEVAPQLKSAELIAEDNVRQNCVSSISSCFQKACKDNIDPNDPDGSYDLCLTRPETMLNLCKVPLNACGIDTNAKADKLSQNSIWNYVVAVMASMRVDSCTNEVKSCLQSPDRCGEDYTQCVGLDLESIKQMCPVEKLVGCKENGTLDDKWLNNLLQGIYLSIDNSMLDQCQKLVDEKMIEICGDTASCDAFATDEFLGTESLRSTKDSNGNFVISGLVSFGNVQVDRVNNLDEKGSLKNKDIKFGEYEINIDNYLGQLSGSESSKALTKSALETVSSKINKTIALLSQDAKIQMCINGRDMTQVRGTARDSAARYPYLLDSAMLTIINSGLDKARANYTKKYNELVASVVEEQNDQVKQALCSSMSTSDEPICTQYDTKDGQPVCVNYAPAPDYLEFLFSGNVTNNPYATEYVIQSANISNLLKMSASGSKNYTVTDGKGNMLGSIQMTSVYSAKNNTCSVTTTTQMCKDAEAVITVNDIQKGGGGGAFFLFMGAGGGGGSHEITQNYAGTVCKEFAEPTTTTESIKM